MAEGKNRPGGEPPSSEQDLLADRRARRASESGETTLARRAEAAEATVRTLETHLTSLQQRVRDAEEESRRMVDEIQAERSAAGAEPRPDGASEVVIEYELRRARQRSHVERQLRIEAEDRYVDLERESRAEIDRLLRRLATSERDAQELAGRLDSVQHELAQAQQLAAGRGAAELKIESELQRRLIELEQSAVQIQRGLDAERAARARSEGLLEAMYESHRQVQGLVGDLQAGFAELSAALTGRADPPPPRAPAPPAKEPPPAEMADALAAAVVRLRERAAEGSGLPAGDSPEEYELELDDDEDEPPDELFHGEPDEEAEERPAEADIAPDLRSPTHKHSLSLIGRLRLARKQRRARR